MNRDKGTIQIKPFLEQKVKQFNNPSFISQDPILIPHRYSQLQDIEIAGFWTAILSWGRRKTIIQKACFLMDLMGNSPHDFILNHNENDRKRFESFKHRTFQPLDTLYFLEFLQHYYRSHHSLEELFLLGMTRSGSLVDGMNHFYTQFFKLPFAPARTKKHISSPQKNSSCKRMNMFLRWMVRKDKSGVDFGCWKRIDTSDLFIPLDVHVGRVARYFGLLTRKQNDWNAVVELTNNLKDLDPKDPIKYDYALFGLGILQFGDLKK